LEGIAWRFRAGAALAGRAGRVRAWRTLWNLAVDLDAGHRRSTAGHPPGRRPRSSAPRALPGFADYAAEVFVLLQAIAQELVAAVTDVADTLSEQARRQETGLLSVLQDALGLPQETSPRCACGVPEVGLGL
jgi:hypothetical protein